MLSADLAKIDNDVTQLRYPILVSPKLDGVRCIVWEGVAYSRNAKPLRNKFVQSWAQNLHNLDGELIVGPPTGGQVLGRSMAVTAIEGEPDFAFHVFDVVNRVAQGYSAARDRWMRDLVRPHAPRTSLVPHVHVGTAALLTELEERWCAEGFEGVMLRAPDGPYKHGRSTLSEGYLIKLKRFMDGEAVVVALEEAEENTNEAKKDELGRTKRSSAKAGKVGKGMVGTIVVKDKKWGEMRLSPGIMTHAERVANWANGGKSLLGEVVHWRAFGYGVKDKPRFPRFYGLRTDK
jgi:DNA ligase-1